MVMNIKALRNNMIVAIARSNYSKGQSEAAENIIKFYKEGQKSPTIAKAIEVDEFVNKYDLQPVILLQKVSINFKKMLHNPDVKAEADAFETIHNKLYSKTRKIREALVNWLRLSFDEVLTKMSDVEKKDFILRNKFAIEHFKTAYKN